MVNFTSDAVYRLRIPGAINAVMLLSLTIQIVLKEIKMPEPNSDQCTNVSFLDYMYSTEGKQCRSRIFLGLDLFFHQVTMTVG